METIRELDKVLAAIYSQVGAQVDPTDHPVSVASVSLFANLPLEEVLQLLPPLREEGFVQCSFIGEPPLLYLTRMGLARVRRNSHAA
ncbi:hypothetical protein EFA69_09480 [Rufibacter immobilis]|uniref:Uncharacterized protein n=1 Tax=Rufibacter immobilis TaxID=1348778 RepID=A0A3M9MY07_9BACT|nr:hypothetical protein [Rufibacter immobilis]RNI29763.1 hypothetical protein EFA69_09480 [Rufibacter immobilis]